MAFAALQLALAALLAQDSVEEARALEDRYEQVVRQTLPAVVGLVVEHKGTSRGSTGSGVIIDREGWILTAGHVCGDPGNSVTVRFADGGTAKGVTAGSRYHGQEDCGLVRFDPAGAEFAVAELGSSGTLSPGEWVAAFGHTYGVQDSPWRPPVARMGRIRNLRGSVLDVDAPISSGDSGGPLVDLDGRVVGVLASAGPEPWVSSATGVDLAKLLREEMERGELSREHGREAGPDDPPLPVKGEPATQEGPEGRENPPLLSALSPLSDGVAGSIVGILCHGEPVALGIAVEGGFVVTKDSEIPRSETDIAVTMVDGLTLRSLVVARDEELDLALIYPGRAGLDPVDLSGTPDLHEGMLVISPGRGIEPMALGMVSLASVATGRADVTAPFLGVTIDRRPAEEADAGAAADDLDGPSILRVEPGSAAWKACLRGGDRVLRIDGTRVRSQAELGVEVRKHGVGDVIEVVVLRDGGETPVQVRLGQRVLDFGPAASTPRVPASRRASGFGSVIQHDSVLGAGEMGGPLLDLEGRVVGLNIARVDRTKTYALPLPVLHDAVKRMAATADPDSPLKPEEPTLQAIVLHESQGEIVLTADEAELAGPGVRYVPAEDPEARPRGRLEFAPKGAVRWAVEVPEAGAYDISLTRVASDARPDVAVRAGGHEVEATCGGDATCYLGAIELPAGRSFVELAQKTPKDQGWELESVRLRRAGEL